MAEKKVFYMNGYVGILILLLVAGYALFGIYNLVIVTDFEFEVAELLPNIIMLICAYFFMTSLTIVAPNQSKVVTFFGKYLGTIRKNGLFITVPFTQKQVVSLKVRNFNSKKLKVNDVDGNPIEIGAVIVFKVIDTARALFDVEYYESFVEIQSETAIRHVAMKYPYDSFEGHEITLRGNITEISQELLAELQERLEVAGVEVLEARLSHLAYSTEIASAMLQRQQAKAILSARKLIVEGAVSMSQQALEKLEADAQLNLTENAKIQLVNNMLVAIISDKGAQPTISMDDID